MNIVLFLPIAKFRQRKTTETLKAGIRKDLLDYEKVLRVTSGYDIIVLSNVLVCGANPNSQQGYGRKIVNAVVQGTLDDWNLVVAMDWSCGFWDRMIDEYPQIVVF